ncbi:hypothetical protein N7U66_02340 [Lacinutrix neustonica]|uniref:Macroglobulin domain-containing protein n=1 Tax=Lacinutrix neustonica TaxID=2980107 RepID=A0A9E8MWC6_9FLAO|nr:hypothetical protein [Lacinutrix neustonica]WAC02561.1 hypothetical protein N7U66_02340 [Lacinutrix neustonica]
MARIIMKKTTIILFAFLVSFVSNGQAEKSTVNLNELLLIPNEYTTLHTTTDFALVGEYLYYKLFVFSENKPSAISKVGYVELIDSDNNLIIKQTLAIKNHSANHHIFIPSQLRTGNYKLIAYTNWSKNNSIKGGYVKDINIINPFSSVNQTLSESAETIAITKANTLNLEQHDNGNITLNISKKNYTNREALAVDVLVNDKIKNGNYSLSIKKLDSVSVEYKTSQNYTTLDTSNIVFFPEMRGKLLVGKITNTTQPLDIENKNIALSIVSKNPIFKMSKTNAQGQFFFNIDHLLTYEEMTIQLVEDNNDDFKIELIEPKKTNYKALTFKNLGISKDLKRIIEQRSIKSQIENAYFENKQDSIMKTIERDPFYYNTAKKYVLDDYTRFKTVRETFIEVIPEAGLRKEGDDYQIIVHADNASRENNSITNLKPLIVVDGMIVQNNNDLIDFNPKKIESISIVQGDYVYGANLYQGVIGVTTFLQDFKTSINGEFIINTNITISESNKMNYQPQYQNQEQYKHIPDYRNQLLWIPNITLNSKNETFKTYTSDDHGTYEIRFEGYTKDGEYVLSNTYFEVK